jgi:hypothetical protein
MKRSLIFILLLSFFCVSAQALTLSSENIPYDASFHLGLVNGPGTGLIVGADVFFPYNGLNLGFDLDKMVTNTEFEQNLDILKYGVAMKFVYSDELYFTAHIGIGSVVITKPITYRDSFSGSEYTIDEGNYGGATYYAVGLDYKVGEFFIAPKLVINNVPSGGSIFELDLNLTHKF